MTYAPTGSLVQSESNRIREILGDSVEAFQQGLDPFFRESIASSDDVVPVGRLGRDYKIIKQFYTGVSGVVEMADSRSNFNIYGDATANAVGAHGWSRTNQGSWPRADDGADPRVFDLAIGLKGQFTNLYLTNAMVQAEALPATVGNMLAPILAGHALQIAQTHCTYTYLAEADSYKLGTIATVVTDNGATSTYSGGGTGPVPPYSVVVTVTEEALHRFIPGMRIDIYSSGGTTRVNESGSRISAWISDVDFDAGTVTISGALNDPFGATTPAAGQIIVWANSKVSSTFHGFAGLNAWMKNSGNLLGGDADSSQYINVGTHSMFKSWFKDMGGAPFTERTLTRHIHAFNRSKRQFGCSVDTLIASDGVWLEYWGNHLGSYERDRTARPANLANEGLAGEFAITVDGQKLTGTTSQYIEDGTVYGVKRSGNWQRIRPPMAGATKDGKVPPGIAYRLVGRMLGYPSDKIPIQRTVGDMTVVTEGMQMPGQVIMQMVPKQIPGMKWTNCATDREYSD